MTLHASNLATDDLPSIDMQCETGGVDVEDIRRQVTKEWVNQALNEKYPGVVVESMKFAHIAAGNSTKIWMDMTYNEAGQNAGLPASMICKAGFDRHDPVMLFSYAAEMMTYRDVLPRFPINSPICYYAGKGPGTVSAAILMEDLRQQKGVRFCHATRPLNKEEVTAFLDAMAKTHARSWNHPAITDGTWDWPKANQEILDSLGEYFEMLLSPEQWEHWLSLARCTAIPQMFHDRDRFIAAFMEVQKRNAARPKIVMIGDTHMGNLYIQGDGTPGFLDFLARVDAWVAEYTYFLAAALDIVDRRAWDKELLQHYLERLSAYGVTPPSFDEAWDAYCENLMFPLFTWMTNGEHFQKEAVNTANSARAAMAAIDHDTYGRLGQ